MPRREFVSIQKTPDFGDPTINGFFNSLRENVELLCALRGDISNHAVTKGDITTDYPVTPVTATVDDLVALKETLRKLMVDLKG